MPFYWGPSFHHVNLWGTHLNHSNIQLQEIQAPWHKWKLLSITDTLQSWVLFLFSVPLIHDALQPCTHLIDFVLVSTHSVKRLSLFFLINLGLFIFFYATVFANSRTSLASFLSVIRKRPCWYEPCVYSVSSWIKYSFQLTVAPNFNFALWSLVSHYF
jgi:hypothetical protein